MKVNEPKPTTATAGEPAVGAAERNNASNVSSIVTDRVTTEEADHLKESVSSTRRMAAGERALRLQALAQEVRSGTYRPNVSQLAAEILAQVELDMRLAERLG
jgi:hypothetical protein